MSKPVVGQLRIIKRLSQPGAGFRWCSSRGELFRSIEVGEKFLVARRIYPADYGPIEWVLTLGDGIQALMDEDWLELWSEVV